MIFTDINVLVYGHRDESPAHQACVAWIESVVNGPEPFGLPEPAKSGFVRIVTNPRIYDPPTSMRDALGFIEDLQRSPRSTAVAPGRRHWQIFTELCLASNVRGNLVPDAYLAALAIEADAELASCDRDFARFPGLRWFNPAS